MHDSKLEELFNAYLRHELDFNEYRQRRTEYIDALDGTRIDNFNDFSTSGGEDSEMEHDSPPSAARSRYRQNQYLWLGIIFAFVIFVVISILQ